SLLALARMPAAAAWARLRHDPGAVLLVARQVARTLITPAISFFPAVLRDPAILDGPIDFLSPQCVVRSPWSAAENMEAQAADLGLGAPGCFVDWYDPRIRPIYHNCLLSARLAERVSELSGRCDPENAWVAGLLAPL